MLHFSRDHLNCSGYIWAHILVTRCSCIVCLYENEMSWSYMHVGAHMSPMGPICEPNYKLTDTTVLMYGIQYTYVLAVTRNRPHVGILLASTNLKYGGSRMHGTSTLRVDVGTKQKFQKIVFGRHTSSFRKLHMSHYVHI